MEELPKRRRESSAKVLLFILFLCVICGFLLAVASYGLSRKQQEAKEFDQSKQMLIAAKILNHKGEFTLLTTDGTLCDATWDSAEKKLVESQDPKKATEAEIKAVAASRIRPLLTDAKGSLFTLEEKGITLDTYLAENKKIGYANLPYKLFYVILPNEQSQETLSAEESVKKGEIFVFPVSGFGLWAPIYGYLALSCDGDHVIGTTWYEHGETPGLGANITAPWWQAQFFNKVIFQESASGKTDFSTAPIGIIVVKGKVRDVYGSSPKAHSAVDGMSGATLTGDGVTQAYRSSLTPYRALLTRLHEANEKEESGTK